MCVCVYRYGVARACVCVVSIGIHNYTNGMLRGDYEITVIKVCGNNYRDPSNLIAYRHIQNMGVGQI